MTMILFRSTLIPLSRVIRLSRLGYNLFYGDEEAFDHFSTNYNFGLVEHDMSGPDYEINSIGKRMETIYDNLFSQI